MYCSKYDKQIGKLITSTVLYMDHYYIFYLWLVISRYSFFKFNMFENK